MNSVVLLGKMDPGDSSEQPYTTENLSSIKGGYRCLSKPVQVLEINFDSIEVRAMSHVYGIELCLYHLLFYLGAQYGFHIENSPKI